MQYGSVGTLTATGDSGGAGIGGNYRETKGTIIINGGIITATGDGAASGIGGGNRAWGGTVIINGGTVTANGTAGTTAGEGAAGIGGGHGGSGGTVTINGGEVTATGSIYAAGIGGGRGGYGGIVTINNGTVIAAGSEGGAGIGGGDKGSGGNVTVNGGDVTAIGSVYSATNQGAAGIGAGRSEYVNNVGFTANGGSFTINGGLVRATGGEGGQYIGGHAIGANCQCDPGSFAIGMYLKAYMPGNLPVDFNSRNAACLEHSVVIELCSNHLYDNEMCHYCHMPMSLSKYFLGDGTESNPYQIRDLIDWHTLRYFQNNGFHKSGSYEWFCLTSDISISDERMIGTSEYPFRSNFDGGGHTLTFLADNKNDQEVIAPFAYVDGTTIRNLHVVGSVTGSADRAAGVIGENGNRVSHLVNCRVSMSLSGKSFVAAFCVGDGGGLDIEGCVFDGSLSTGDRSGGFVGWTNGSLTVSNSLFAPDSVSSSTNCYTFYYKGGSGGTPALPNSYRQKTFGTAQGTRAFSVTGDNTVTIDFGTPDKTYNVSGITAYTHGIIYKDVFYAGEGEAVTMADVSAVAWDGYSINSYTVSAGTMTAVNNVLTLTMPSEDTVIHAVQMPMFDTAPTVHLTADDGTDGYRDQDPDKLFDGDDISKWCCAFYGNNYVEFHSDVPVVPTAYSMTTASDTSPNYLRRNPYSWKLWAG